MKPLRTVLLYSAGHLGSATILNLILESKTFKIKGIVKAYPLPFSFRGARRLKKNLRKTGWRFGWLMFWQQLIQGLAFLVSQLLPRPHQRLLPGWRLAKNKEIPIFYCDNVNDKPCRDFISALHPDLVISAYFNQILLRETISIPVKGVLNIHPGWLPSYRGAMCYFWVLKKNGQKGGVTVHWIDEGIDTGSVLARESFDIQKGWTQQKVLETTAVIGARLVENVAAKIAKGLPLSPVKISAGEPDEYFCMPGEADFDEYFRKNRYFRIKDIFRFFFRRKKES